MRLRSYESAGLVHFFALTNDGLMINAGAHICDNKALTNDGLMIDAGAHIPMPGSPVVLYVCQVL